MARKSKWYGWIPDLPDQRESVMRARRMLASRLPGMKIGEGCTRHEGDGDFRSLSTAYKFRRFLEGMTILCCCGKAWYCDSLAVRAVLAGYDRMRSTR